MGSVCSAPLSADQRAAKAKTKRIEQQNKSSHNKDSQKIKLLLLGAGESGKSTLFKQMKILYGTGEEKGFTDAERKSMRAVVHQNVVFNFKQLLCSPNLELIYENGNCPLSSELKEKAVKLLETNTRSLEEIPNDLTRAMRQLWREDNVVKAWEDRGSIQVQDALEYYMAEDNFSRIVSTEYIPTDQDILRSRVRTSGIVEEEFKMGNTKFVMVDVGGQRNERRKWIHAFEDVDCVIFVAAISEYNQVLYEDNSVSRQQESVELFQKVAHEEVFQKQGLVLFLNKCDLFRAKLLTSPFRVENIRNEDYTGPESQLIRAKMENKMTDEEFENSDEFEEVYQQSLVYLESVYRKKAPPGKQLFVKVTCATDTQQVQHIMDACKEVFLRRSLQTGGFR